MKEIRAPRGNQLSCKGWVQEAAMRMLMNNLDPDEWITTNELAKKVNIDPGRVADSLRRMRTYGEVESESFIKKGKCYRHRLTKRGRGI